MAPRHNSAPCFVSPHPDALARARLQVLRSQRSSRSSSGSSSSSRSSIATASTANSVSADTNDALEKAKRFLATERQMPGLNDGTIFPASHFDESVSLMAMGNAALERTPLRSVIR
jgi:immune inhibitor A